MAVAAASEARTDIRSLSVLSEIGKTLASGPELRGSLERILEKLEQHRGTVRAAVFLLDESTIEIGVEAAVGIPADGLRARYKVGEGVVGKVVQSGRPIVIPATGREPLVMNRAFQRRSGSTEWSLVCVPILLERKPAGALAVDFPFDANRDYQADAQFLSVVASMIAQSLRANRTIEAERNRLLAENSHLRQELEERYDLSNIVGTSGPMRQVYEQIAQVAQTNTTVMIRGESGTGKELIAHALHYNSPRAGKPFVKVSCAALPETLIEAELFGYEKGAFTGAQQRKQGRFDLAEGGTLFLDEIGELNLASQVKLLRVLQEREFERLGGTETVRVDVRLVVATNRDLEASIAEKQFREDLYYRLNVFSIFMPPLRDRKPDLMPPPPAHAADGRGLRHGGANLAVRRGRAVREGPDRGRAEERARQPREGGAAARKHRADHRIQGAEVRDRSGALPRGADGGAPASALEVGRPVALAAGSAAVRAAHETT